MMDGNRFGLNFALTIILQSCSMYLPETAGKRSPLAESRTCSLLCVASRRRVVQSDENWL